MRVGGFRPARDPLASNFGLSPVGLAGKPWPRSERSPLLFVCQLNLTTAPLLPALLADIRLITFFVDPQATEWSRQEGLDWRLCAYTSLDGLVPLVRPSDAPSLARGFECAWEAIEDHPDLDDPERVEADGFEDPAPDQDNVVCTKVGGYPSLIQSEPWWDFEAHPACPAYCLQIDSEPKVGLAWGDNGVLHLARGTAAGAGHLWFLDAQTE